MSSCYAIAVLWRIAHRFLGWGPPAFAGLYGGSLTIAATAASINKDAHAFLDGQVSLLKSIVTAPTLPIWLAVVIAVWFAAFLWTGEKAEAQRAAQPVPGTAPAIQQARQARAPLRRPPARNDVSEWERELDAQSRANDMRMSEIIGMMKAIEARGPPTPDLPLNGVLVRLYKLLGPPPTDAAARLEFDRKVNHRIADDVALYKMHVWGRIGDTPLRPILPTLWARGNVSHRHAFFQVRNPDAGKTDYYHDLTFSEAEADRIWPKEIGDGEK